MRIITGGAALCTAAERWSCVPRVLRGARAPHEPKPARCAECGAQRLHRRKCATLGKNASRWRY